MSGDSESHFTITFGQSGRVVKRSGGAPDDGISGSGSVSGSKPSVKDRLGTIVDDSLADRNHHMFKRQRVEQNQGFHRRNGSNDTSLGNGDLRLKLLQKNVSMQFHDNDPPTIIDLRDKLSSKATLPSADRRSCFPLATLGKRKSMMETRDNYDGRFYNMVDHHTYDSERQNIMREPRGSYGLERRSMRDPRDTYSLERRSMRDPRDTYSLERRSMRDPRDAYSIERQRMRDPRDAYSFERQIVRDPRDTYGVERQRMRDPRDTYSFGRESMREPRDSYDVGRREPRDSYIAGRRSIREPRDSYNFEKRSIHEPRDSYNVDRRRTREPRDNYSVDKQRIQGPGGSYNIERRTMREPRETNSIERRSIRESRVSYSVEEQSMQEHRDNYSLGRRSIREPRDTCNVQRRNMPEPKASFSAERRNMREPRDACSGGKPNMLDSRDDYDYRRMANVVPGSNMGSDVPAVGHSRTPYTLDSLRRRSPDGVFGASRSPERTNLRRRSSDRSFSTSMSPEERTNLRPRSPDRVFSSSMSPEERTNLRRRSPDMEFSSSISPEGNVEELQRKELIRTYDDGGTSDVYRRNEVSSPQRAARSATLIKQPGSTAVPHLPGNATPVSTQIPQSSRVVPRISNHVEQPTIDSFLQSLDLEEYSSHFNDEEVDFHALREMSDIELKELGIPMVWKCFFFIMVCLFFPKVFPSYFCG